MDRTSTRCERCLERRAIVHYTYGHGIEQHVKHFCEPCSRLEPSGWQVVVESRPSIFSPLGFLAAAGVVVTLALWLRG